MPWTLAFLSLQLSDPGTTIAHHRSSCERFVRVLAGDEVNQPLPVAAAANEAYKAAKAMGYGDNDMSAVHEAIRK